MAPCRHIGVARVRHTIPRTSGAREAREEVAGELAARVLLDLGVHAQPYDRLNDLGDSEADHGRP